MGKKVTCPLKTPIGENWCVGFDSARSADLRFLPSPVTLLGHFFKKFVNGVGLPTIRFDYVIVRGWIIRSRIVLGRLFLFTLLGLQL